ncbi:HlyD family secretion protein [Schlesneria paludicola]|uniref:HlyD family secretion protein n=1 Tax=Schlesneria paludicola TaxID=360056 RepID=UPI000299F950|nr:efflux RND transporter periplasmic adaptor subunit [Schlesneria paludicola]
MSDSTTVNHSLKDRVQSLRLPPPAPTASGGGKLPWILVVILGCAVAYLLTAGSPFESARKSAVTDEGKSSASATPTPKPATASQVAGPVVESKGYIIPEQQILVSPQVSGRVLELNFEAGQRIERDFVLAVLDNTEYQAEYERVYAMLEASKANLAELREGSRPDEIKQVKAELAEAQTNLEQAERDYKRAKELSVNGFVNKQDFETSESQYQMVKNRVARLAATTQLMVDGPRQERKLAAEAQVRQAEAELRRAKWRLDNCTIVAPISGTVLKKNAELGNLVNPVAFNGSFSLCDMADLSKLEVELSIQEREISKVKKGQRCKVQPEAYMDRSYDGVVSRLMPIADRAKGAVPVRVRLKVPPEEEGQFLKPEMGAIVRFYDEIIEEETAPPTNQLRKGPSEHEPNATSQTP